VELQQTTGVLKGALLNTTQKMVALLNDHL